MTILGQFAIQFRRVFGGRAKSHPETKTNRAFIQATYIVDGNWRESMFMATPEGFAAGLELLRATDKLPAFHPDFETWKTLDLKRQQLRNQLLMFGVYEI